MQAPSCEVLGARVVETTEEATLLEVDLRWSNGNAQPLPMREAEYQFAVDGETVFSTRRAVGATIPQNGEQTISLPVVIPAGVLDVSGAVSATYGLSGVMVYEAPGQIAETLLDTGIRVPRVRFSGQGALRRE